MTGTWAPAPAGRTWDSLDPLLAMLARAVEAEAAPGGLHQVRWEPGRRVRATYQTRADARVMGSASGPTSIVVLDVSSAGITRSALPDDPALPGAYTASQPEQVRGRLAELCSEPVRRCTVAAVSYRPGSRCVLRYDVVTDSGSRRFYAKLLAEGFQRALDVAAALDGAAQARGARPFVPTVADAWEDLGAVVTQAVPGRNVSAILADAATPVDDRVALARGMGELLAAVHATPTQVVPPDVLATCAQEVADLRPHLDAAWHADPVTAASLSCLLQELSLASPPAAAAAFGHGAFRCGQVLAEHGCLTALDLDGVCRSDPARDAGNAMAYVVWQGICGRIAAPVAPRLIAGFHAGYQAGGGHLDLESLGWWQAVAMAKIAGRRYRSAATSEWPHVPALLHAAHRALAQPYGVPPAARSVSAGGGADRTGGVNGHGIGRTVPELLDPAVASAVLRPVLAPHALGGREVTVQAAEVLRSARGRRVTLRYRVGGLAASPVAVIAKVYAQAERASFTHRTLLALSGGPFAGRPGTAVPLALGLLPARGMLLYREALGRPMHTLDQAALGDAARHSARWLQTLHRGGQLLDRRFDLGREMAGLPEWAAEVARRDAELGVRAQELARRLQAAASALPTAPSVPIHKDLHPGHVLIGRDGALTVIDLDEARMGDPAFDVAHMRAYLEEMVTPGATSALIAFLEEYGHVPGPCAQQRVSFFGGYTRLKIAKQLVRGSGPHRAARGVAGRAQVARVLERGLACLAD